MVVSVAAAIFVLGLVVLVHELGHFVTAKMTGMRVDEFSIGFGPQIVSVTKGETMYSIRIVPLGGYVEIAGGDPARNDAGECGYCRKPVLSRMIVTLAGVTMNVLLPIVIFWGTAFVQGVSSPSPEAVIGAVLPDMPAEQAGLQSGDRILRIDGKEIGSWKEFVDAIPQEESGALAVLYARDGETAETTVQAVQDSRSKHYVIGVFAEVRTAELSFAESGQYAFNKTGAILNSMLQELKRVVQKMSGESIAGPLGIAQMAGEVAQRGVAPLLNFAAILSLNLAVVNMLPIPAMDGGQFLTLAFEAVRGKPLSVKTLRILQTVGIVMLLMLMLLATKNDVLRVFFGSP